MGIINGLKKVFEFIVKTIVMILITNLVMAVFEVYTGTTLIAIIKNMVLELKIQFLLWWY